MWEIDIPFVRRDIGAFGQEAEIAEVTMVDNLPVVGFIDAVDFHGFRFIDQVEQGGKSLAQTDTAPAAMTYIKDPLEFVENRGFIGKAGLVLSQGMASRGLKTAFAGCR